MDIRWKFVKQCHKTRAIMFVRLQQWSHVKLHILLRYLVILKLISFLSSNNQNILLSSRMEWREKNFRIFCLTQLFSTLLKFTSLCSVEWMSDGFSKLKLPLSIRWCSWNELWEMMEWSWNSLWNAWESTLYSLMMMIFLKNNNFQALWVELPSWHGIELVLDGDGVA